MRSVRGAVSSRGGRRGAAGASLPQAPSSGAAARPASSARRPIRGAWSLTRRMMTPAPRPRRPVRRIVTGVRGWR
ncbi:hypothetical protein DMP17_16480 [Pseudonocardia sp. TMWB2A]